MTQLTLMNDAWGYLEVKVEDHKIALVERYGPSYKVIILSISEADQVAHFIHEHLTTLARKEAQSCQTAKSTSSTSYQRNGS